MDLVPIGESNKTEQYAAAHAVDALERNGPLSVQDPELSGMAMNTEDAVVEVDHDIRVRELADDKDKHSSSANKVFEAPPGISLQGSGIPDITFMSVDHMSFQVHRGIICTVSWNDFNSIVHDDAQTFDVPETSAILNALLCAIYDIPGDTDFETLKDAVGRMEKYGLTPPRFIHPTKAVFVELCMHADQHAIDVFILAAKHDLDQLARVASSHLLSFNLQTGISDEMADEMGVIYLRRLFLLHMERLNRLKGCLTIPPVVHDALDNCAGDGARNAWIFPAVALMTTGRHDISPQEITAAMVSGADRLWCSVCCGNYMQRVSTAVEMWSKVRSTI